MVWAISDREDAQTLEVVWTVVKKRCPPANVSILMTDDGKITVVGTFVIIVTTYADLAGVLACSQVYPGVQHILCRWHVDRYEV